MGEAMLANINQEVKNIKRIEMIGNYKYDDIFDFSEITAYYDTALNIISYEDEMFLKKNNVYNYVMSEKIQELRDRLEGFKKLAFKFSNKPKVLVSDQIKSEGLKYKLNDILNSAAVMLMYKGNFNQAYHFFDLNYKLNDDELSRLYLSKVEELNEFIFKYNVAIDLIKLESYGDALKILEDYYIKGFRTEKGDILLTLIYFNRKSYAKTRRTLNSMNDLCKSTMFYYEIHNELSKASRYRFVKYAGAAAIVLMCAGFVYGYRDYFQKSSSGSVINKTQEVNNINASNSSSDKNFKQENNVPAASPEVKIAKDHTETFKELEKFLADNDLKGFDKLNKDINYEEIKDNDRKKYDELLKRYKISSQLYYYNMGREYYKKSDYEKSIQNFNAAYGYKNGEYLDEHVVFMLGQSLQKKGDFKAVDYYREYINGYKSGSYVEEALYNMSLLYFSNNRVKEAKDFAKRLNTNYKNSMYNNQKIRAILES
jgi:tetratricopeptide (TPR) repeat protein